MTIDDTSVPRLCLEHLEASLSPWLLQPQSARGPADTGSRMRAPSAWNDSSNAGFLFGTFLFKTISNANSESKEIMHMVSSFVCRILVREETLVRADQTTDGMSP